VRSIIAIRLQVIITFFELLLKSKRSGTLTRRNVRLSILLITFLFLANHTRCSTNLSSSRAVQENDVIVMTCSITYSGNWAPVMRWFNSVTRHNFTDDVIALTTSDTTVTSQLTVAAAALHGCQIVCVTYFTQHSPALPTSATNIPSYTHEWTSLTLDVRCKLYHWHIMFSNVIILLVQFTDSYVVNKNVIVYGLQVVIL